MGTRLNRLTEAVLTCTHNQCFEQKLEKYFFKNCLKINIFTVVKYCCILHGHVCIMDNLHIFLSTKCAMSKNKFDTKFSVLG